MFILNRLLISSTYVVYSNVYVVLETQSVRYYLCSCFVFVLNLIWMLQSFVKEINQLKNKNVLLTTKCAYKWETYFGKLSNFWVTLYLFTTVTVDVFANTKNVFPFEIPGTWTDQWWVVLACTTQRASWMRINWIAHKKRAGLNWRFTSSLSSTIYTGKN